MIGQWVRRTTIGGKITRRRFFAISAAAAIGGVGAGSSAGAQTLRWQGTALGAEASISFANTDGVAAREHVLAVRAEIDRIESLFSLYRKGSAIRRLNATGRLDGPAPDFVRLLRLAGRIHDRTGGAFDPTVQSLSRLHAIRDDAGQRASSRELAGAVARGGWRHVEVSAETIAFSHAGMSITLNGIAQGHAADRISSLLKRRGLKDVLIDTGEIVALGRRPAGDAWRADVATPDGHVVRALGLADRALATSAPNATFIDRGGGVGHILDPRTGRPADHWRLVSVSAETAAVADGLSTAFCLMPRRAIDAALAQFPDAALEVALHA